MAELWSGFLQLNHFPRDNAIDLSVKGECFGAQPGCEAWMQG